MISIRTLSRYSLYNIASFAVYTLLMLVATPALLRALGPEVYGLWMAVSALLGFLGILDFGLGDAIVKYGAEHQARGDREAVAQVIGAAVRFYAVVGTAAGVLLFLAAPALPALFRVSPDAQAEAILMFRLASVGIAANLLRGSFLGLLDALMRYDLSNGLRIGFALVSTGGSIAAAFIGGGPAVVAWIVLVSWLAVAVNALVVHRVFGGGWLRSAMERTRLRALFRFSGFSMLTNVGSMAFMYADRLVVGAVLGPAAIGYYAIAASLAAKINQLGFASAQVMAPAVSAMRAVVEPANTYAVVRRAARLSAIALLFTGAVMFALCDPFLRLWLGESNAQQISSAAHWLILAYSLFSLNVVFFYVIQALGAPEVNAALTLAAGGLTLALIPVLGSRLGLTGAAIANFAFLITLGANVYALRRFDQPAAAESAAIYGWPMAAFAASVGLALAGGWLGDAPYFGAIGATILFGLLLWRAEPGVFRTFGRRFSRPGRASEGGG
jgi:O-antigen/teichoic acid export membrane protein